MKRKAVSLVLALTMVASVSRRMRQQTGRATTGDRQLEETTEQLRKQTQQIPLMQQQRQ